MATTIDLGYPTTLPSISIPGASPVLSLGTTPAATGQIRLPTSALIQARNFGNNSDIVLLATDTSDSVYLGDTSFTANTYLRAVTSVNMVVGANTRIAANTTGLGFMGTAPVAKPTVTGAKGSNAALASLMTALAAYGLVTDSTTA